MNDTFLMTAVVYVLLRSFVIGYSWWRECVKAGYNKKYFEKTGEKVPFQGGFFEGFLNIPAATLVALISPKHISTRFLEVILAFALYALLSFSPIVLFSVLFIASVWLANKIANNIKPKPWPAKENEAAKREWFSSTKPWHKVDSKITDALIEKFRDDPMFEVFVVTSMKHNLVARYAELANQKHIDIEHTDLVCSDIAVMLCLLGNASFRAMGDLMQAHQIDQTKMKHHYRIVLDTFETAIILDHNQIQAYLGLATVKALVENSEDSLSYAKQGLSKLRELKADDSYCDYVDQVVSSGAFPDMAQEMDEMEKALDAIVNEHSFP